MGRGRNSCSRLKLPTNHYNTSREYVIRAYDDAPMHMQSTEVNIRFDAGTTNKIYEVAEG